MFTSIEFIMRKNSANVIMTKGKSNGNCYILMAKCLAMPEAVLMTIQRMFIELLFRVILRSLTLSITKYLCQKIVNLMTDIKKLLALLWQQSNIYLRESKLRDWWIN